MTKEHKNTLLNILIILLIFFVLFTITKSIKKSLLDDSNKIATSTIATTTNSDDIIVTPSTDEPTVITGGNKISSVILLDRKYIPSQDVYTTNYDKESIRLALNGEFEEAYFEVNGKVFGTGRHFLSFNFDSINGILNATRKSKNELDLEQTKLLGGVFVDGAPIQVKIPLLKEITLSSTREEFDKIGNKKSITLWTEMQKKPSLNTPTIITFLIAPFNEYGQYGGAEIDKIEFKFTCKKGVSCGAGVCVNNQKYTECLKNLFGIEAAKSWCNRSKEPGCENL